MRNARIKFCRHSFIGLGLGLGLSPLHQYWSSSAATANVFLVRKINLTQEIKGVCIHASQVEGNRKHRLTVAYQRARSPQPSTSSGAMTSVDGHTDTRRMTSLKTSVNGTNSLATSAAKIQPTRNISQPEMQSHGKPRNLSKKSNGQPKVRAQGVKSARTQTICLAALIISQSFSMYNRRPCGLVGYLHTC